MHATLTPLRPECEELLIEWSAARHPEEACGVIIDGQPYSVPNVASDPTKYFVMDMNALIELYTLYGRAEAVWHSHPEGRPHPSSTDLESHPAGKGLIIVAGGKVYDHGVPF